MTTCPWSPLYNNPTRPAPVLVERHRSKLRSFRFKLIHQPCRTNPADYGFKHPPPPRTYTMQEKQELGVEEEDAQIQVGRVQEELSVGVTRFGRVDTEPPLEPLWEDIGGVELCRGSAGERDQSADAKCPGGQGSGTGT